MFLLTVCTTIFYLKHIYCVYLLDEVFPHRNLLGFLYYDLRSCLSLPKFIFTVYINYKIEHINIIRNRFQWPPPQMIFLLFRRYCWWTLTKFSIHSKLLAVSAAPHILHRHENQPLKLGRHFLNFQSLFCN